MNIKGEGNNSERKERRVAEATLLLNKFQEIHSIFSTQFYQINVTDMSKLDEPLWKNARVFFFVCVLFLVFDGELKEYVKEYTTKKNGKRRDFNDLFLGFCSSYFRFLRLFISVFLYEEST
jgi:hypothetical protein